MALSVAQFTQVSNWFTANAKNITGVNWSSGDIIVVISGAESDASTATDTPSNANLTFGAAQATQDAASAGDTQIRVWSATAGSSQSSQTIALTGSASFNNGGGCWVITGSPTGVTNATANLNESATSRTVSAGSVVIYGHTDWNATNPQGKTPATGSGTATERRDAGDASSYGQYLCEWVGTSAGTFSFGTNNYTSLQVAQCVIEVLAPAGGTNAAAVTATATAAANTATTTTSPTSNVSTATGSANAVAAKVAPSSSTAAATGAGLDATVKVAPVVGVATATGAANNATVTTGSATNAPATVATATGAALDATAKVAPTPTTATATAAANNATVSTTGATNAPAGVATATGFANDPQTSVKASAATAAATGAANNATVTTGSSTSAPAGVATATGTANGAANVKIAPSPATATATASNGAQASIAATAALAAATAVALIVAARIAPTPATATATGEARQASADVGAFPIVIPSRWTRWREPLAGGYTEPRRRTWRDTTPTEG